MNTVQTNYKVHMKSRPMVKGFIDYIKLTVLEFPLPEVLELDIGFDVDVDIKLVPMGTEKDPLDELSIVMKCYFGDSVPSLFGDAHVIVYNKLTKLIRDTYYDYEAGWSSALDYMKGFEDDDKNEEGEKVR